MTIASGKIVYMDNNATSQVAPEVVEEMMPYLTEAYGNPSSMYNFGGQTHLPGCSCRPS